MEEGYRLEDWMDLPVEEGTYMISPPRVTNISKVLAFLTVNVEEDELLVHEASRIERSIKAQLVTSVCIPLQLTYLLPLSIKAKVISTDLERIRTMYCNSDEYQMRVANPKERTD